MVYQGSKNKLAKYLKLIIEGYLKDGMSYVEPFVGGANLIDKINWEFKYGYDINSCLINLLNYFKVDENEKSYIKVDRAEWNRVKYRYKHGENGWYIGYVGFICSFCGKFFDGYGNREIAPDRDLNRERFNNLLKQSQQEQFKNVIFECKDFKDLYIKNSVIYLDPPYRGVRRYNGINNFNHNDLWVKCDEWFKHNNVILLSELESPSDKWVLLWEKPYRHILGTGKSRNRVEKLFIYVG